MGDQKLRKNNMTDAASEETRPLLGREQRHGHRNAHADGHQRRVIATCFVLAILTDCAALFLHAPQTSILEGIICSRHYGSLPGEHDCTVGPVQAELATVDQLLNTFNRLPGLIVAVPFGIMADRYGRRPVLFLCILGTLLQDVISKAILWRPDVFPPRLIWLSSAATLVGGGEAVASFMVYLVVADVASPTRRANLFFLVTACGLAGEVFGTPLSAFLMSKNAWIPYFVYSAMTVLAGMVSLFLLPETLPTVPLERENPSRDTDADEGPRDAGEEASTSTDSAIASRLQPLAKRNVIAVLLAFFVAALGRQSSNFLLQYIRQRFNWKYEQASLLMTLRAVVNLALLLAGLPILIKVLVRRKMSIPAKDLLISRLSVACFALGSLVISVAPVVSLLAMGIAIFALGSGFTPAARSLATTFVHEHETGLLYSALAIMQSAGGLIAGPLLALSFRWGLSLGHEWTGMPFAVVAVLFGCGYIAISFVRL